MCVCVWGGVGVWVGGGIQVSAIHPLTPFAGWAQASGPFSEGGKTHGISAYQLRPGAGLKYRSASYESQLLSVTVVATVPSEKTRSSCISNPRPLDAMTSSAERTSAETEGEAAGYRTERSLMRGFVCLLLNGKAQSTGVLDQILCRKCVDRVVTTDHWPTPLLVPPTDCTATSTPPPLPEGAALAANEDDTSSIWYGLAA